MPQIRNLPLPLRQKYLSKMYPTLTVEELESKVRSPQQRAVFTMFYGFGCEPLDTSDIRARLNINKSQQISVQLERVESKLGVDKDERLALLKALKREYYRKYRPKCPYCRASRSEHRNLVAGGRELSWCCGKCHRLFKTPNPEVEQDSRVQISFWLTDEGEAKNVVLRVNGQRKEISGWLEAVVGDEDWRLELGGSCLRISY